MKIKGILVQDGIDCSLIKMQWMIDLMKFDQLCKTRENFKLEFFR